jgi:hypothetical protein
MKPTEQRHRGGTWPTGCGRSCCTDTQLVRQSERRAREREAAAEIRDQLADR